MNVSVASTDHSTSASRIVVVGAGHAAARAVETLRQRGFAGTIAVVGEERCLPYQRPPLSKKYLAGHVAAERLSMRQRGFYADRQIDLHLGRRVEEIDRRARRVRLDDESSLEYDRLLLATGSSPRVLSVPGAELKGVHFLRSLADADGLRVALERSRHLVIVGGGYIGLEVAATCRELGAQVTVLEAAGRVLSRVVGPEVSAFYEAEHTRRGARIVCNARVRAFAEGASGHVGAVVCEDGHEYRADAVLIAVGVSPATQLAADAGLECCNGVRVDERCRTSAPDIYAAGDCTSHPSSHYGYRVRLESVDNAVGQGTTAALNMLGIPAQHETVPWFWSDQFDLKLITVGLSTGYDRVVLRGDPATRNFSACYLRDGELIGIDTVNRAADQAAARTLIAARARPDVTRLADAGIALPECM